MKYIMITLQPVIWFFQLFSTTKSFQANPIIGSPLMNRLGLHLIRVVIAHGVFAFKQWWLGFFLEQDYADMFRETGYVCIENFLNEDTFDALEKEVRAFQGVGRACVQGDTVTKRVMLDRDSLVNLPCCTALAKHKQYLKLLRFCSARNESPRLYIQQIQNQTDIAKHKDPQKTVHMDTFHPTMKAWLFLDDVDERNGPFCYVPGSNRLTWKRLRWLYQKSIAIHGDNNVYSRRGSFRIDQEELADLGLPVAKAFHVKKNTLVIANTFGFHCRGSAQSANSRRLEIWAISRVNPFNPWLGINSAWVRDVRDRMYQRYEEHQEARAKKRGVKASWASIKIDNF